MVLREAPGYEVEEPLFDYRSAGHYGPHRGPSGVFELPLQLQRPIRSHRTGQPWSLQSWSPMLRYRLMLALVSAGICLCTASAVDAFVRWRMRAIGRKWVFLRGGTFNYNEYLEVCGQYGWRSWPICFMWVMWIAGIALLIVGCVIRFGTHPQVR